MPRLLVLFIALLLVGALSPRAAAHQPYGGCDEAWQAPRSEGAAHCRAHGWIVGRRVVISPSHHLHRYRLPSCAVEDASRGPVPCGWNVRDTDGNGRGRSYVVTGSNDDPRFIYLRRT
ncbi:MAG: hypothetical protein WB767_15610 [Nocardioides sp.]